MLIAGEARDLEIGRQGHEQEIDFLAGRADRLRIGAAKRQCAGLEIVPDARIGKSGLQRVGIQSGDALQVWQGRHVHDRHRRLAALRDGVEELAHTGRAVLRLLHGERDEIVIGRLDVGRPRGQQLAGQVA